MTVFRSVDILPLSEFERLRWRLEFRLKADLSEEQRSTAPANPLYHYTDRRGLRGIIDGQSLWFTDYRHLNDPTELFHGVDAAISLVKSLPWPRTANTAKFLDLLVDLLRRENFNADHLSFFVCSFSKHRDDLNQWRAYGDNGRGYAIGLSPRLFDVVDRIGNPDERVFVGPVRYAPEEIRQRYTRSLHHALDVLVAAEPADWFRQMRQPARVLFYRQIANELVATSWIWNSLTSKHQAYHAEGEVRLLMVGSPTDLSPYLKTRTRGVETVPFVPHRLPLRESGSILEIVVGPAAPADEETKVRKLLQELDVQGKVCVKRSSIPYRTVA